MLSESKNDIFDKDGLFTMQKNRTNLSAYIDQTFYLGKFTLSGGLNGNLNSDFGAYWHGGTDLSWNISRPFKLWTGISRSLRLPTFTDLYYKSAIQASNPDIKPETAISFESGLHFKSKKLIVSTAFWYRWGKNMIDWVKVPDSTKWESHNITKVNAFGLNANAEYSFGNGFIQSIRTDYTYQHLNKEADGYDSKYALDYLKNKLNIMVKLKLYESSSSGNISAVIETSANDRAGTWTDFSTNTLNMYLPYVLCNMRIKWNHKAISTYADINNLFNTKYADFGGLVQAGIMVRAGVEVVL
jgi:iron complex outermembrane receptor protein